MFCRAVGRESRGKGRRGEGRRGREEVGGDKGTTEGEGQGGEDRVRLSESKGWWERWHTIICLTQFTEHHAQVGSEAVSGTGLQTQV